MTGLYPYVGNLQKVSHPIITIDGNEAETQLYSGSCIGEHERTEQGETTSWEGYKMLLEDGTYLQQACRPDPSLAEPVTVYAFTKITDGGSDSINPTLDMQFTMDYDKTGILTYGFNGSRNDPDTGNTSRNFSIPSMGQPDYDQTRYLIALGEDIGPYTLQGYANGGCDPGTEIQGVSAHVRKYETTLGEILQETASAYYEQFVRINPDTDLAKDVPIEMYFSQIYRSFAQYKSGGELITEQFQDGMLEDIISQILYRNRVFYRAFSITVPAEGQIKICAEIKKEGSFDYACTSGSHAGITGYDMVTQLGSILKFRKQTASISNIQSIEIIRQNFGFDPTNEILTVELSPSVEHYYLEVRTVTDQ